MTIVYFAVAVRVSIKIMAAAAPLMDGQRALRAAEAVRVGMIVTGEYFQA